jgi:predicted nucleic acid-binding protein
MRHLFLDTNVLIYALGEAHPLRAPCRALVRSAGEHEVRLHLSVEAVQEFLHHRMRRVERETTVRDTRNLLDLCRLHPFDEPVVRRSIELVSTTAIRGRDAVHAATALQHGFTEIVSTDPAFDGVPGLRRLDPADL